MSIPVSRAKNIAFADMSAVKTTFNYIFSDVGSDAWHIAIILWTVLLANKETWGNILMKMLSQGILVKAHIPPNFACISNTPTNEWIIL